jgi:hypothetical protein
MAEKAAALLVVAIAGVVLAAAATVTASGIRPYGERAISEEIEREDGALCSKFGFAAPTQKSTDCMLNLSELRHRHIDLLASYSWL